MNVKEASAHRIAVKAHISLWTAETHVIQSVPAVGKSVSVISKLLGDLLLCSCSYVVYRTDINSRIAVGVIGHRRKRHIGSRTCPFVRSPLHRNIGDLP